MFPPIFPIYIEALTSLNKYATLIWMSGVICLWLTRYTHQLGKRLGGLYYAFSAFVRPLGVLLIALGWLALYAPERAWIFGAPRRLAWLPKVDALNVLFALAALLFFALGLWSVVTLGLRRTFLFRSVDDRLVARGPYALVRHPQFLSAIGIAFCGLRLYDPNLYPFIGPSVYGPLDANWVLFTLSLWLLALLEDRELAAHFGTEYEEYARRVPRLFPN